MIRVMLELKVRVKYRVDVLKEEKQVGGVLNNVKESFGEASARILPEQDRPDQAWLTSPQVAFRKETQTQGRPALPAFKRKVRYHFTECLHGTLRISWIPLCTHERWLAPPRSLRGKAALKHLLKVAGLGRGSATIPLQVRPP